MLLGFDEDDVAQMADYVSSAMDYVRDANDRELWNNLTKVLDLIDGLLIEGRV